MYQWNDTCIFPFSLKAPGWKEGGGQIHGPGVMNFSALRIQSSARFVSCKQLVSIPSVHNKWFNLKLYFGPVFIDVNMNK